MHALDWSIQKSYLHPYTYTSNLPIYPLPGLQVTDICKNVNILLVKLRTSGTMFWSESCFNCLLLKYASTWMHFTKVKMFQISNGNHPRGNRRLIAQHSRNRSCSTEESEMWNSRGALIHLQHFPFKEKDQAAKGCWRQPHQWLHWHGCLQHPFAPWSFSSKPRGFFDVMPSMVGKNM